MGARQATWTALAVVCLLPAPASASVVMDPIARLALEGGYDSNVAFDGRGGGQMGRISPDVGLQFRDHTWTAGGTYGLDVYEYPSRTDSQVINQRGELRLQSRLDERTTLKLDGLFSYAPDPIGLARLGYVVDTGNALLWRGDGKLSWRASPRLTLSATFYERAARLDQRGVALHAPGAEAGWRLSERTEIGASYRFDWFQKLGDVPDPGTAHEALAFARWQWTRRLKLEAKAGPALWRGPRGPSVVPEAEVTLYGSGREYDLRFSARHGVGINALARSSLADSIEAGFAWHFVRSFVLRGDGGFWRGGLLPDGAGATTGYGGTAEIAWLARPNLEIGVEAARYARLDTASAALRRNQIGLRVAWHLLNH